MFFSDDKVVERVKKILGADVGEKGDIYEGLSKWTFYIIHIGGVSFLSFWFVNTLRQTGKFRPIGGTISTI